MESKDIKRIFSRIGLGVGLFMIASQIVSGLAAFLVNWFAPGLMENGWYFWALSYLPLYLIGFPILVLIFKTVPDRVPSTGEWTGNEKISPKGMAMLACISFGIVYPLNLLSTLLNTLITLFKGGEVINPLLQMMENSSPWASFLFVVIVAPVMEELVFRKFLYNKLIQFGGKTYIIFSAAVFAMFHGNLYQLLYAFVLGVLLAGIMYYTRDIRFSIALHIIVNLFGGGISAFLISYADTFITGIYGIAMLFMAVIGILLGVSWWRKRRSSITFSEPETVIENKKLIFLNPGMIIYTLVTVAIIIFMILM